MATTPGWVSLLLAGALAYGCSTGTTHRFEDDRWRFADSVSVEHAITDTSQRYRLDLSLSVTDAYRYRNLYIKFRVEAPGGDATTSLPVFLLSDSAGSWRARRSWAGTYSFSTTLNPSAQFTQPGTYRFWLAQYMREDTLAGVHAVGLKLTPVR
ncbi:MAG: gliding motility lipoprotein GldH [Bacteroidia bacterium]|nr:gliding motility lipoprotein GldH [Bacteroidia bacterium]